jgi:RNA polymerase sigma-70 factor (ECF subfamily)
LVDRLAIKRALESIPARYKRVLVLQDIEGYQHNEITAILGCTTGTSKSQLHKARVLMCELLTTPATGSRTITARQAPLLFRLALRQVSPG